MFILKCGDTDLKKKNEQAHHTVIRGNNYVQYDLDILKIIKSLMMFNISS